jgi:hypothetical protein
MANEWVSIRTISMNIEQVLFCKTLDDELVVIRTMANGEGPFRTLVTILLAVKTMPMNRVLSEHLPLSWFLAEPLPKKRFL